MGLGDNELTCQSRGTPEAGPAPATRAVTWLGFLCDDAGRGECVHTWVPMHCWDQWPPLSPEYSSQKQARKPIKMELSIELKRKSQRQKRVSTHIWQQLIEFRARPWCNSAFRQIFWQIWCIGLSLEICIMETYTGADKCYNDSPCTQPQLQRLPTLVNLVLSTYPLSFFSSILKQISYTMLFHPQGLQYSVPPRTVK